MNFQNIFREIPGIGDNFKKFYLLNHDTVQKDLDELYDGFSEADKVFLNTLWERNVKILPLSKYTAENMYLLKTDALFLMMN